MLTLVVLISGGGSNLTALLEAAESPDFPARVIAVGADRDADGLDHAEHYGIPTFTVPMSSFASRDAWGDELLSQIHLWRADLVVLSGFMKLLPPRVVEALSPNIINTHPSYLPQFPGAHAVRDALQAGATETGASVIKVDNGVDSGPIIVQERVAIAAGDTEEHLHARIKPVERRLLLQTITAIATNRINLKEL